MYTVETISSVSNAVPLKPFCQVSFWFREQRNRDLISEAEDTTHKGKWSVGDWKNDSGKSMAFREGELVFLKWWDSCEVVCNWDSTASNGNIYRTKTHAKHMAEVIGFFFSMVVIKICSKFECQKYLGFITLLQYLILTFNEFQKCQITDFKNMK